MGLPSAESLYSFAPSLRLFFLFPHLEVPARFGCLLSAVSFKVSLSESAFILMNGLVRYYGAIQSIFSNESKLLSKSNDIYVNFCRGHESVCNLALK